MKKITQDTLIDFVNEELPPAERKSLLERLATDATLAAEVRLLRGLMQDLAPEEDPAPSSAADDHFAAMLAGAMESERSMGSESLTQPPTETPRVDLPRDKSKSELKRRSFRLRPLIWKFAAAAAAVALVFTAGRYVGSSSASTVNSELAANRALMLELMKDDRTSNRIRATTVTLSLPQADPETITNLGYLLRNDRNANVRLAALEALRRFIDAPQVRTELLTAIAESPPDVVRFELIETLVAIGDERVVPHLDKLIETDSLPRPIRDVARMGRLKLI